MREVAGSKPAAPILKVLADVAAAVVDGHRLLPKQPNIS
jgi:hypothetical protein